jgi:hypothetical protein
MTSHTTPSRYCELSTAAAWLQARSLSSALLRAAASATACALAICLSQPAARADKPRQATAPKGGGAQAAEAKTLRIGDVEIRHAKQVKGAFGAATVTITGPNTTVDVPDKNSGSHLSLHADEIVMSGINQAGRGQLDLRGNINYTLTRATPQGVRRLTGTAGRGSYRRESQRIELTDGVECELVDPRLDGPGALRASAVTVDMKSEPYLFTLQGDADRDDLRFTPRPGEGKQNGASRIGPVHITHWTTGTFQAGKIARFDGALAAADLRSRTGTPEGRLEARHIQADFAPSGEIAQARAADAVHFQMHRPLARKAADGKVEEGREELTGTSSVALYEPVAGRFTLDGDIDATIVNTLSLAAPARLLATRLVVTEPTPGQPGAGAKYELSGAPNHRRLTFTPRPSPEPAPVAAGAQPQQAFRLGSIVLTGFQTGVLQPGQKLDVVSDGQQPLLLDTTDPKTHSSSHLETHHFTATLADTGAISEAQTVGPVSFHLQQPAPAANGAARAAARPAAAMQSLDGTAARAVYKQDGKGRAIALEGPFEAKVTDPSHLAAPGSVRGQKDDTLSLDLVTREFTFDTPHETMVFEFTPKPIEPAADRPAPVGGKGKK